MKLFSLLGIADSHEKTESDIADISLAKSEDTKHISKTMPQRCAFNEKEDKDATQNIKEVKEERKWHSF